MKDFKPNILVVDDSKSSLALICDLLGGFYANLMITQSAKEALDILATMKIHIIISDVNMPEMDGFTLAKKIRAEKKYLNIPLILMSGSFTDEVYQNLGLKLGAIDYINKELIDTTLPQKVKNLLEIIRFQFILENDIEHFKIQKEEKSEDIEKLKMELNSCRAANSLKSQILMILFQQIRNPLNSLLNNIDIFELKNEKMEKSGKDNLLKNMKSSAYEINDILEVNALSLKAITKQLVCDYVYCKIDEYFSEVIDGISNLYPNIKIGIFYKNIDDKEYLLDQYHLKIIFDNLIDNAIKYSGNSKEIKVTIEIDDTNLKFCIQDFGVGIPEEFRKNIFEPFISTHNVSSLKGVGLGLAIVKNIVQALKGDIYYESKIDYGTTFTVQIPLKRQ